MKIKTELINRAKYRCSTKKTQKIAVYLFLDFDNGPQRIIGFIRNENYKRLQYAE